MPPSTYRDQFVKLIDKGYLVQRKNSNTYDFYETPQRDTHTKKNDTPDGLDFTADVQDVPQTVNDEAAEDIEININNTGNYSGPPVPGITNRPSPDWREPIGWHGRD